LVFEDSPETWSSDSWLPPNGLPAVQAAILAIEPISSSGALIDFYGEDDWPNLPADIYVDIVGGGNYSEVQPAATMGPETDPVSVGRAASTQFLKVFFNGPFVTPGPHLYTTLVPSGDVISGEIKITSVTPPATIYVWASVTAACQSLDCAVAVNPEEHHARGVFTGADITVQPTPQDLSIRYLDLGEDSGTDCTGPLSGFDDTINNVAAVDVGDYGAIYDVDTFFGPAQQETTDWYMGPSVTGNPLAIGTYDGSAWEDNGQQQICGGPFPLPLDKESISSNSKAVFLGTYERGLPAYYFYQLAGGAESPERLYMAPSTVYDQPMVCVNP